MEASGPALRRTRAVRYVAPLREGGSLPALVEDDRGELVVVKFRGAGQGLAALVAEIVAGELARAAGFAVPEITLVELDPTLARTERDEEIGDLLRASLGLNVALAFLPAAWMFDPAASDPLPPEVPARLVAFDAWVMNVDRTARNPNLLWWRDALWLIDHGAALLWHHGWDGQVERPERPVPWIRDHVLLPSAPDPLAAAAWLRAFPDDAIARAVACVPDELLPADAPQARRDAYVAFLQARRDRAPEMLQEVADARRSL